MTDIVARALASQALNRPIASPADVKSAVNDYLDIHPVTAGATEEEAAQIAANAEAIENFVLEQDTVPTEESNKIWLKTPISEVQVPTMEDFNRLEEELTILRNLLASLNLEV